MDPETNAMLDGYLEERKKRFTGYWAALGQFIHEFSGVERELLELARYLAGLQEPVAQAVLSSLRVDDAKNLINRILDARGETDLKERLQNPLDQLGAISTMRNSIVHWGAEVRDDGLIVSNNYFAPSPDRIREFPVSDVILLQMTADLHQIGLHLFMTIRRDEATPDEIKQAERVLQPPWLYKSPQPLPRPRGTGTRARRRERKRQGGASRE